MDEFEKLFSGTWVCDRNENLKETMEAMKMPKEELEFFLAMKPEIKIERKGYQIYHSTNLGKGIMHDVIYELGKGFESKDKNDPPLYHNKVNSSFQDGKLIFESRSQLTGPRKIDTYIVMYKKGDELISDTSPLADHSIIGRRVYKRA